MRCHNRFYVDNDLKFLGWGESTTINAPHGKEGSGSRYYHEVVPRIFIRNDDAVEQVLTSGTPLEINGYVMPCVYGAVKGAVQIEPLFNDGGDICGARVSIDAVPECLLSRRIEQLQPLVDIGKVASTLAHGVRNPLNAIKGGVVYLKTKYAEESTLVEFADMMEEEIARLDGFITRFLSTSFFDNELTETDLNALLKKVETYTSLQAAASGITARFIYGQIPPVRLNPFQIEQVVLNIVNNAIDAMDAGGKFTVMSSAELLDGKGYVVVEITDSGPGMPESSSIDISLPVPGGDNGTGRGFGLFIAREVIQHHGGRLEIRSSKGDGTAVRVCLPVL